MGSDSIGDGLRFDFIGALAATVIGARDAAEDRGGSANLNGGLSGIFA